MTLDRDIRFTPWQISVTQHALRDEIKRRTKSIEKAEAAREAGRSFQAGTLQEHYSARDAAREVLASLEVARRQIGHQIEAKLNS